MVVVVIVVVVVVVAVVVAVFVVAVVVVLLLLLLSLLLLPHINSYKKCRVRGNTKVLEDEKPNKIKIRPGNTTLSRLKRTIRRRRTIGKVQSMCKLNSHAAGIHSTTA